MLRVVSAALLLRQAEPDPAAALPALRLALVELQEVGTRLDLGYARTEQARALLAAGDLAAAGDMGRRALLDLATGDRLQTGHALLVVGRVAMAQGETDDALALLAPGSERVGAGGSLPPGRNGLARSWVRPTSSSAGRPRPSRPCAAPATSPARRTTRCVLP